jgi:alpha-D-ribose 1-methylphosphonate 5-triphosphate synthase subunit PhnG
LTYTEGGRTKTITLSRGEVAEVQAALARYEQARAKLERAAQEGIVALRGRRGGARTQRKSDHDPGNDPDNQTDDRS